MPPKGDFEVAFGPPWGGIDYSRPYNAIDANNLAPGSVNNQAINGFLCSSPWIASHPFSALFQTGEYPLGFFPYAFQAPTGQNGTIVIVVTNLGVYYSGTLTAQSNVSSAPIPLNSLYVWQPSDVDSAYMLPNNAVSFVEVNNQVFFTGLMLNGVYVIYFGQSVTGVTITSGGTLYTTASAVFSSPGIGGTTATGTVNLGNPTGIVTSVQAVTTGDGYFNGATANIAGGGGAGASCTPHIASGSGHAAVIYYTINSGGSGYTSAPGVIVLGIGGDGSGATARAYISTGGSVESITITDGGSGYTSPPTINISGDGSGAGAVAIIGPTVPPVPSLIQATNYVAGAHIIELGGRLVVGQCKFPTGGGTGTQVLPTVAWSGNGAYIGAGSNDPWNPANASTLAGNVGGFNLLADVPDQITGMSAIGRSGIIGRTNGYSQIDPGPSGTQPFDFYHLWSSDTGVGALPNTMAQWGQQIIALANDNVYSLSISGGLQPVGDKIIARILADAKAAGYFPSPANGSTEGFVGYWYHSSIVEIAGQLHYLLAFSCPVRTGSTNTQPLCFVYDLNVKEGSWHVWDMSNYYINSGTNIPPIALFTCAITSVRPVVSVPLNPGPVSNQITPLFLLAGTQPQNGSTAPPMLQFVPYDYDYAQNITQNSFSGTLYPPFALPASKFLFRGETVSLGHKITVRRLRIQVDNAPMPTIVTNASQQAKVMFTGQQSQVQAPILNLPGNSAPTYGAIQTYYGDANLSDEIIQPSIESVVEATNPWSTLAAFRLASVSLIAADTVGTQQ